MVTVVHLGAPSPYHLEMSCQVDFDRASCAHLGVACKHQVRDKSTGTIVKFPTKNTHNSANAGLMLGQKMLGQEN